MLPTFHTVAKDPGFPYLFAKNPHLEITCRYSSSADNSNELVFMHVYPAGQEATRELLQSYRTEAHAAIKKRLGINLFYMDTLGNTITVVTSKAEQHQGEWILTGDIKVRFSSARAAGTTYEQQNNHQRDRATQADRLLGYTRQACPTFTPTGHSEGTSQDDSLNKSFTALQRQRQQQPITYIPGQPA